MKIQVYQAELSNTETERKTNIYSTLEGLNYVVTQILHYGVKKYSFIEKYEITIDIDNNKEISYKMIERMEL